MLIELWPVSRPVPYGKNPRKNSKAVLKLAGLIREVGFRQPIVVDAAGVIVVGHTRLQAAKSLGMTEVPVHVATDLTPAQIKAYRIADNRVHEEADWDRDLLKLELEELKGLNVDLGLTCFDTDETDAILAGALAKIDEPSAGAQDGDKVLTLTVVCTSKAKRDLLADRLTAEGYECRTK